MMVTKDNVISHNARLTIIVSFSKDLISWLKDAALSFDHLCWLLRVHLESLQQSA